MILADADPFGSDLLYRLRGSTGLPLDAERGLLSRREIGRAHV